MAVSKRTRYEVLRRDNFTCRYCRSVDNPLKVDHVTPVALGGTDHPANLVAACQDCNIGKSSTAPEASTIEDVSDEQFRWARAITEVAKIRAEAKAERNSYVLSFATRWEDWCCATGERVQIPVPLDWRQSIWKFYEVGLPVSELLEAVDIAGSNQRVASDQMFRYMCGIAWKMVAEIQDAAKALLAVEENTDGS